MDRTTPVGPRHILADVQPAFATTSWVNAGGTSNCLAVTSQDSTPVPGSGWSYCLYPGYYSPPHASVYLPNDPLRPGYPFSQNSISVLLGSIVPVTYNPDSTIATFTRTDSLTCDNAGTVAPTWTGTETQNFKRVKTICCSSGRAGGCRTCYKDLLTGGTGTLNANVPPAPPPGPPATVVVSPDSVTAPEGQAFQLWATVMDSTGYVLNHPNVAWTSSDTTLATVSVNGLVTPRSVGVVYITGTSGSASGVATITVTPEGPDTQP